MAGRFTKTVVRYSNLWCYANSTSSNEPQKNLISVDQAWQLNNCRKIPVLSYKGLITLEELSPFLEWLLRNNVMYRYLEQIYSSKMAGEYLALQSVAMTVLQQA